MISPKHLNHDTIEYEWSAYISLFVAFTLFVAADLRCIIARISYHSAIIIAQLLCLAKTKALSKPRNALRRQGLDVSSFLVLGLE
jgi:hypothetical protein